MRTPFGKVSKLSVLVLLLIVAAIVAGLIVPGRTGTIIEVVGWLAFVALALLEFGERGTTPFLGNRIGDERRRR